MCVLLLGHLLVTGCCSLPRSLCHRSSTTTDGSFGAVVVRWQLQGSGSCPTGTAPAPLSSPPRVELRCWVGVSAGCLGGAPVPAPPSPPPSPHPQPQGLGPRPRREVPAGIIPRTRKVFSSRGFSRLRDLVTDSQHARKPWE